MAAKLTNSLACIPDGCDIVRSYHHEEFDELILTRSFPKERVCPVCGSTHCIIKSSNVTQSVRHIAISRRPLILTFQKRRLQCKSCGISFYEDPDWVVPGLRMTVQLASVLYLSLMDMVSLHLIALNNGITLSVLITFLEFLDFQKPNTLPVTICCDEFAGETGSWDSKRKRFITEKFHTAISNGDSGYIMDILPTRKADDVVQYFMDYPLQERQNVRFFCCDMCNGYVSVARRCFPNAVVCIDLFHVVFRLNSTVDVIRRRLQNEAREKDNDALYYSLYRLAKTLKTAGRNTSLKWGPKETEKKERLQTVFKTCPNLHEAYLMLQDFHKILDLKDYWDKSIQLGVWISSYLQSDCPDIAAAARTIKHWKGMILNSWKYLRSNGPAEGLNNKIKVIKRVSFGMHRFDLFRKRILLVCGSMTPSNEYIRIHWNHLNGKKGMS